MYDDLKEHLTLRIPKLKGAWIHKHSGYEDEICRLLKIEVSKSRYQDGKWQSYAIEFKKGHSIWLDLVRYSEILLKHSEAATVDSLCLFFIPNKSKSRIEEIVCVRTSTLIKALRLTKTHARQILKVKARVPHALNAQARLTVNEVKGVSKFIVRVK